MDRIKANLKLGFKKKWKKLELQLVLPLVLHGGTGIPTKRYSKAIPYGTAKLMLILKTKLHLQKRYAMINKDQDVYDPRKYLGPAREAIKETVKGKIREFGTSNRAK